MDVVALLGFICVVHGVVYFFDAVFKSCSHVPYLRLLEATGLKVEPLQVKWFTTVLNRPIQKWGVWRPRFQQVWFSLGMVVSLLLLPVALIVVGHTGLSTWGRSGGSPVAGEDGQPGDGKAMMVLEPVIPGINFPLSELGYYVFTIIVSSFLHEIGHAVAAVREDVHISGMGFFIVFILPVAFVYLDPDQLSALAPARRLRILCAGIWHNIFLSLTAAFVIMILPWIAHPLYDSGYGVQVVNIPPGSSLSGPSGLKDGDVVTSINDCSITSTESWHSCLLAGLQNPTPGYCALAEFVRENDESIPEHALVGGGIECCGPGSLNLGHLCFQLEDESGGPIELPEHSCLSARALVEQGLGFCAQGSSSDCAPGLHCLRPMLANATKLVILHRSEGKVVLFVGSPVEIYHSVEVSSFVSRWSIFSPAIPQSVILLCKYLTGLSAGLALINLIPCWAFDGQHIVAALCDMFLTRRVPDKNVRSAIALCATMLGTIIIIVSCVIPFARQLLSY